MKWIKTGNILGTIALSFVLLTSSSVLSQVTFIAKPERTTISINEEVEIHFEMNQDGDNFIAPSFEYFNVLSGPSQSISSSWINGKTTYNKSYNYVLSPKKTGVLTIGQASIAIDGKVYKSSPVSITVKKGSSRAQGSISSDVFLVVKPSKSIVYLNEAVELTYKLYVNTRLGVSNFRESSSPDYGAFWVQNMKLSEFSLNPEFYGGKSYNSVVVKRDLLFPQKSGFTTISPLILNLDIEIPTSQTDFFGRKMYRSRQKNASSKPLRLKVLPLPKLDKPADFTGAVGQFEFKTKLNKTSLNTGESVEASIIIEGTGNFKLFDLPKLNLPKSLETYQPEYQENTHPISRGLVGFSSHKHLIVPLQPGTYTFPKVAFSYFDPLQKKYITKYSGGQQFLVSGSPMDQGQDIGGSSGASQKNIIDAAAHFNFIKRQTLLKSADTVRFFKSTGYYTLWLFPLALGALAFIFVRASKKGQRILNSGTSESKLTRRFLKEAKNNINHPELFYVSLDRALINFFKHKLKIQISDMTKGNLRTLLLEKGGTEDNVQAVITLMQKCEYAKYSPSGSQAIIEDYEAANDIISKLNKELHS